MYPKIEPYRHDFLTVTNEHSLYFEEVGNPNGIPIILLHGGPGGGISPYYRRLFDPKKFRAVLFDQRGSGQSTPYASTKYNNTPTF